MNPQVALDALYAGPSKTDGNLRLLACESTVRKSHRLNPDLQV